MSLFRLAYISVSAINGCPEEQRLRLGEILFCSRLNNSQIGVTGALLASADHFAQLLEGERQAVERLYGRIAQDPRHRQPVILFANDAEARLFPEWSMAYIDSYQSPRDAADRMLAEDADTEAGHAARGIVLWMGEMLHLREHSLKRA